MARELGKQHPGLAQRHGASAMRGGDLLGAVQLAEVGRVVELAAPVVAQLVNAEQGTRGAVEDHHEAVLQRDRPDEGGLLHGLNWRRPLMDPLWGEVKVALGDDGHAASICKTGGARRHPPVGRGWQFVGAHLYTVEEMGAADREGRQWWIP
jgi:hypothetical protein